MPPMLFFIPGVKCTLYIKHRNLDDHLEGLRQEQLEPVGICLLLTFFLSQSSGEQNTVVD